MNQEKRINEYFKNLKTSESISLKPCKKTKAAGV